MVTKAEELTAALRAIMRYQAVDESPAGDNQRRTVDGSPGGDSTGGLADGRSWSQVRSYVFAGCVSWT